MTFFAEVALLLAVSAAIGLVGSFLRQPLIVGFIAAGLLAGPSALNIVGATDYIELMAELGIAVLLFLVGIKLDVALVRSLGYVAVVTGLGQVVFTSFFGYLIGLGLGLGHVTSLYVAVALTFSSTIIIVKLLSDKREIDSLHGQIALGFLIVQDLCVVAAMVALSAIGIGGNAEEAAGPGSWLAVLAAGTGLAAAVFLFVKFIATPLTVWLARSPELLTISAIAIAAIFAAAGEAAMLGKEIGGLLAGIALASTPYRETISARLAPLRDFLLLFFFVALGAKLDLSTLGAHAAAATVFSAFVLIGNPLIVLAILGAMGYAKRTGFLAGLTVAQISEFSLIFTAMGVSLGHVGPDALGLVTMVGLVTIAASTYMIVHSHRLYALFEPVLGVFERGGARRDGAHAGHRARGDFAVVVFGLGRFGTAIGNRLRQRGIRVLGIDFNPQAVKRWRELGLDAEFGDASDPEFVSELPLRRTRWILSTVPIHPAGLSHEDARRTMIQLTRSAGFRGRIAAASHGEGDRRLLLQAGVDLVLEPFQDAADRAVELLCGAEPVERIDVPPIAAEGGKAG
jgi:Kef-type K+ transport system membrane component KefB/voltage-gated potassium channel Kch